MLSDCSNFLTLLDCLKMTEWWFYAENVFLGLVPGFLLGGHLLRDDGAFKINLFWKELLCKHRVAEVNKASLLRIVLQRLPDRMLKKKTKLFFELSFPTRNPMLCSINLIFNRKLFSVPGILTWPLKLCHRLTLTQKWPNLRMPYWM